MRFVREAVLIIFVETKCGRNRVGYLSFVMEKFSVQGLDLSNRLRYDTHRVRVTCGKPAF